MKKISSITLLSFTILASCTEESKTISTDETSNIQTKSQPKIQYDSPIIIGKTDILLYPLRLNDGDYESYKREVNSNHWNLIFHNVISGKSELLTKEKVIINSFNIGQNIVQIIKILYPISLSTMILPILTMMAIKN